MNEGTISALVGVAFGACLNWFLTWTKEWWTEGKNKKRRAVYLAIRVVCLLDEFVDGCISVVNDDGCKHDARATVPDPPSYPGDVDWKSIKPSLMYKILSLPTEIELAKRTIMGADSFSWDEDFFDLTERQYQYARMGLVAIELARQLRKTYDIPDRDFGWREPAGSFRETMDMIDKDRREAREAAAFDPHAYLTVADGEPRVGAKSL
jgi:hypothetical protein